MKKEQLSVLSLNDHSNAKNKLLIMVVEFPLILHKMEVLLL